VEVAMYPVPRAEYQTPRCIVCGLGYKDVVSCPDTSNASLTDADIAVEYELTLNLAEVA